MDITVKVKVDTSELDEALRKAKELLEIWEQLRILEPTYQPPYYPYWRPPDNRPWITWSDGGAAGATWQGTITVPHGTN